MSLITVVGAGYVGLVSGASFAELGHKVCFLEIDRAKLEVLKSGRLPIYEPGLESLVATHSATGQLTFSDDYAAVIPNSELVFLAVATPSLTDGAADTSSVFAAARSVFEHAPAGLILVIKSTVPPGTADELARLAESMGVGVEIVSNPEFLRQGAAVRDFLEPDRIVVGAANPEAGSRVAGLYRALKRPVVECSRRSAELSKYAANVFLATRISLVNEVASLCDVLGADIEDVTRIVGLDARLGSRYLCAGIGWGGSCLPKDVSGLQALAATYGLEAPLLAATARVNDQQRERILQKLSTGLGDLSDKVIGLLGLSFKPGTDDIRGSPAIQVARSLLARGAQVKAHDPFAMTAAFNVLPEVEYAKGPYQAVAGCDAVLLATEWPLYLELDWLRVQRLMAGRLVVDGRNVLDKGLLTSLGFSYASFGRSLGDEEHDRAKLGALPVGS